MLISRLYSRRGSSDALLFLRPERLWLARNDNQSNEKRVSGEGETTVILSIFYRRNGCLYGHNRLTVLLSSYCT